VAVGLGVLVGLVLVDRVVGVTVAVLLDGPDLLVEDDVVVDMLVPEELEYELESWYKSSNFPAPQYSEGSPGQGKLQLP
jgi:hypothetical protein